MKGVAMVVSEKPWLADKQFLEKHGFESVDQSPPSFELMVRRFGKFRPPSFIGNWDAKLRQCDRGLTIFRSDQCPYIDDAVRIFIETAKELKIKSRVVDLHECQTMRDLAPSPYGVFNVVYNGSLLAYHYLTKKEILKRVDQIKK